MATQMSLYNTNEDQLLNNQFCETSFKRIGLELSMIAATNTQDCSKVLQIPNSCWFLLIKTICMGYFF